VSDTLLNAIELYGLEPLMVAYYEKREFVNELLRIIQSAVLGLTQALLEKMKGDIAYSTGCYGTATIWSPAVYRQVFAPLVAEQSKLIKELGLFHAYFMDGKCMDNLETIQNIGIDIFLPLEPPPTGDGDLKEAKTRIGKRVTLWGNIDPIYILQKGTDKMIENAVKKAIDDAATDGGFILGTGERVTEETPIENIKTMVETAKKYGGY